MKDNIIIDGLISFYKFILDSLSEYFDYLFINYFLVAGLAFLLFYVIFKKRLFFIKIQKKSASYQTFFKEIFNSLTTIVIFTLVFHETIYNQVLNVNIYEDIDKYGYAYFAFTFIWMIFLDDFYEYWTHRLLHSKILFKWVHLSHHKSTNPSPFTAYSFNILKL